MLASSFTEAEQAAEAKTRLRLDFPTEHCRRWELDTKELVPRPRDSVIANFVYEGTEKQPQILRLRPASQGFAQDDNSGVVPRFGYEITQTWY
jgi:hypothetical protein